MVNLYDSPAQAQFINTYVPIQFDSLYKMADQAKESYSEGMQILDRLSKYRSLNSQSDKTNQRWAEKVSQVNDFVSSNVKDIYSLSDPNVLSGIHSMARNLESDPEIKAMLESKEAMNETLKKADPRWGSYYKNKINQYDPTVSGVWNENALEYIDFTKVADDYTKELEQRKISTTNNGFTDIYGVPEEDVINVIKNNRSSIVSDPSMRARAESDLGNMHANGDANIMKYATKGEDGQLKIDQNSIDKYILDNVSAAALDRTKARVEKDNTYKMFMYEEQQKAVRHAQTLAATERKNETTRLSSLIQTDAKSNILSGKVNFAVNSINSAVAGISDPAQKRKVGASIFGEKSYMLYETYGAINNNNAEINRLNAIASDAQAKGTKPSNDITTKINNLKAENKRLGMSYDKLVVESANEVSADADRAIRFGKGNAYSYESANMANVYTFNSSVGNEWNKQRYGNDETVKLKTSNGGEVEAVAVSNPSSFKITNNRNLNDNVDRWYLMRKKQKDGSIKRVKQSDIQTSVRNINNALAGGRITSGAFMVDGGTARFYGDGSSRKLNYIYVPKSELENQSISGLSQSDIMVLRKLPGATVENMLLKEGTSTLDRIEKAYYRIPVSSDYMNDDPSSPERVQLDKSFSGSSVYKDNNAYQEE